MIHCKVTTNKSLTFYSRKWKHSKCNKDRKADTAAPTSSPFKAFKLSGRLSGSGNIFKGFGPSVWLSNTFVSIPKAFPGCVDFLDLHSWGARLTRRHWFMVLVGLKQYPGSIFHPGITLLRPTLAIRPHKVLKGQEEQLQKKRWTLKKKKRQTKRL